MLLNWIIFAFAISQVASFEISPLPTIAVKPFIISHPNPCNQNSTRFMRNQRGCSWFWECKDANETLHSTPHEGKCPDNLHIDVDTPRCTYDFNIVPRCTFDEDNLAATPTECVAKEFMRLIPHPFSCNKYFLCWQNLKIERECVAGQHFSFFDNACVSEFQADCRAVENYCNGIGDGNVNKDPFSCEKYHICTKCNNAFNLLELQCHQDTHQFSSILNHCDATSEVNCWPPPVDDQPVDIPDVLTIECPSTGFFNIEHPDSSSCDFYFTCNEGRSFLRQCTPFTFFDKDLRECVYIHEFECPDP